MIRLLCLISALLLLACDSGDSAPEAAVCRDGANLVPVYFRAGGSALDATAQERLSDNMRVLRGCPELDIVPRGYVDGCSQEAANGGGLRLSQARADVVRDFYLANGLADSRLGQSEGRGVDPATSAEFGARCTAPMPDARRAETTVTRPQ